MRSYKFLEEVLHKVRNIENILKLLSKGQINVEDKLERMCPLDEIRHETFSHDAIKESLAYGLRHKRSANIQQLKLIEGIHKSSSSIPVDLVKFLSKAKIECQNLWRLTNSEISKLEKRKECFTNLIKLTHEAASIKSQQLKRSN